MGAFSQLHARQVIDPNEVDDIDAGSPEPDTFRVVVFWEDRPQFTISRPKVNEGFTPPSEEAVANFVSALANTLSVHLGRDWWDCGELRRMCKATGLPTSTETPGDEDNDFLRVDVY